VGPIVLLTWLIVAFSDVNPQSSFLQAIFAGLFWGTMFGHTTLAAVWSAFGPWPLVVRLPLSFLGGDASCSYCLHLHFNGGPVNGDPHSLCLLGQWLFFNSRYGDPLD
jgi:hypothetical protein